MSPIVSITAEDPDSGLNGKIKYSILKQDPPGNHFGIDADLGVIFTKREIDREFSDTFRLTILAKDQAIPIENRLSAEKLVTVIVEDLNDNKPQFSCMNAAILKKSSKRGTKIANLKAIDLDSDSNGVVTYEMVSGDRSLFSLDRVTGSLMLERDMPEVQPRYKLTIRASDEAIQSQRKSSDLSLSILGISEKSDSGQVAFSKSLYKGSILEEEPIGSVLLTVVAAFSGESLSESVDIEYYITNVTSANGVPQDRLFEIDVQKGMLTTAAVLDRDIGVSIFYVEVYAIIISSKGLITAKTRVELEVLDKNDSPPEFPDKYPVFEISENAVIGHQIGDLKAEDRDLIGTLSYSIISGGNGNFQISKSSGVLSVLQPLDREVREEYQINVRASDEIQSTDLTVLIKVLDENDNSPTFSEPIYSFDIPEDAQMGTNVGELVALDADKGMNGAVTYSVLTDWGNDVFSLNSQTGLFTLTARLDYEDVQHYIFVVQAQDGGSPSLSSTSTVFFNVVDLNDNMPIFDPLSYNREIFENISVGSSILSISATDHDSGLNGQIEYSILSGDESGSFEITANGTLLVKKELDREQKPQFNLMVKATDMAIANPLFSTVQVNILLKDVNDQAPTFISPNMTTLVENVPINTIIMAVKAIDGDEGRNGYVEYLLMSERSTFFLGSIDGLLKVSEVIDREITPNFTLKIMAKDRGVPAASSMQELFIQILDQNDNSPNFDPRQYNAEIHENVSIGMSVLKVSATDIDEGINSQIRYSITSGDPNNDFIIGEDSGVIRIAKTLNYERKSSYTLTVKAEDSGEEVRFDTATVVVLVINVNDNAPVFLHSPYLAYVRENMIDLPSSVIRVSAHDSDLNSKRQVRFLIKDGDKGSFRVNASTGEITVHRSLDREKKSEYTLTIVAMDTGTPRLTGTGMVRILVQDVNDYDPVFEHESYDFSVEENVPVKTNVAKLTASDLDEGINSKIKYNIIHSESDLPFEINQDTGEIFSIKKIDREARELYQFTVEASDSNPFFQRKTFANLTFRISDQNDNPPVFENPRELINIPDNIAIGGYIFGVSATDQDVGLNSRIRYYLGGEDADKFQIDQKTGIVKSLKNLGKLESRKYDLELQAMDSSPKDPLSATLKTTLVLMNHERFPGIKADGIDFSFPESIRNEYVTTVRGISKGSFNSNFNYYIGGGNLASAFVIDKKTGVVRVSNNGLDYEITDHYELWIEVENERENIRSSINLNINVTDTNDNPPIFEKNLYNLSVLEEEYGPKLISKLIATDLDSGENGRIRYQFTEESQRQFSNIFGLDADTGEIFTKVKLDREETQQYTLGVEALDFGTPSKTGTATVIVVIEDANDNPPRFTRLFSVNVTENAGIGTFVIQVTSVDKDIGDNARCTYSLVKDNNTGKFQIDPISGNITVSGMLDREIQDEYLLKVSAIDGSWRAETLVTITIQDVNDNSPEFEYSFYSFNIPEDDNSISFIGQVTASDRDKRGPNSFVTYSLKNPSAHFSIDPVTGEIFSKKSLMYKPNQKRVSPENEYNLIVKVSDNGKPPLSSECYITINVVDSNNHSPKFQKLSYFSPVLESSNISQRVFQVRAVDEDYGINAEIEYNVIGGNASKLFSIEKESGWIFVTQGLVGKKLQRFSLQLRAIDKGIPPQSSDVLVTLSITGVNRFAPKFTALSYRVIVPENEMLGTNIVTVTATDSDVGSNGEVIYGFVSGNEDGKFSIDESTGAVTIANDLDFDIKREYLLNISATDLGFYPRISYAELSIILTDINDHSPEFELPLYEGTIKENSPINTELIALKAIDKDSQKYSVIRYSIVGGSGKSSFLINPNNGSIMSKKVFDYEERKDYLLEILASNPDSNLYGTTKVRVNIAGENEFFPRFVQQTFHFTVSESAGIGAPVGSVQATDEDAGNDGRILYLLVGSSNDRGFSINSNTGLLSVSRRLDRESQSRIVLTVLAKNIGSIRGNDTDEAQIIITVQDGNDPPVFEKSIYNAELTEGVDIGTSIVTVIATDVDVRPVNNRFSYQILSGNHNRSFKIDPINGNIRTAAPIDREQIQLYNLTIGAIDMGQPPQTGTTLVTVLIHDKNDNGPILSTKEGSILENEPVGTKIMILKATDADHPPNGEPFKFVILPGPDSLKFKLDENTGLLSSAISFDREMVSEYNLQIEIQDNGLEPQKSIQEIRIAIIDKNDSPSLPRNGELIIYLLKDVLPNDKIATIEPIDADITGEYNCRFDKKNEVFEIPNNCNLFIKKWPHYKRNSFKYLSDDGKHSQVSSTTYVEFFTIDNNTIDHSIVIRALGSDPKNILDNYSKLISFFKKIFRYEPHIYTLVPQDNSTDILLAIGSGEVYESVNEIIKILKPQKAHLEDMLSSSIIINYSPCALNHYCQNGGTCSQSIRPYADPRINANQHLILSSPTIQMEFKCICPFGFTGVNCQLRKEPCSPNPCEDGGFCTKNGFDYICTCPPNRGGKRCELTKSNLCEENPCLNGGSCKTDSQGSSYFCLCRPGYFGGQCEAATDACKPNPCLNGGECITLPSSLPPICKCPKHFYGRNCEKSAYGFAFGSFLSFPSLDPSTNDFSIVFSTNQRNALLLYDYGEQTGGRSDFVSLEIREGRPSFSYGGTRTAISSLSVPLNVDDGEWHRIIATRNGRVLSLSVSNCENTGEICHECRPGNSSCYADGIGPTGTLNFNGNPVLIGGVDNFGPILERPGQVASDDFIGCVHSVVINGKKLNLSAPIKYRGVSDSCQRAINLCGASSKNTCGIDGNCIDLWERHTCECNGIISPDCDESFEPYTFGQNSFIEFKIGEKYKRSQLTHNLRNDFLNRAQREISGSKSLSFSFRTIRRSSHLLLSMSNKDYTLIEIDEKGSLKYRSKSGSRTELNLSLDQDVTDGKWHTVSLHLQGHTLYSYFDGRSQGDEIDTSNVHDFLDPYLTLMMIGGFREEGFHSNYINTGFSGCIANLTLNNHLQPLNGSQGLFDDILTFGKVSKGCSSAIAAAVTDPLSIGVTLVIVFFVVLLVGILVSFVIFRVRKREKCPLPSNGPSMKHSSSRVPQPASNEIRGHMMDGQESEALRHIVRNSKKMLDSSMSYQKPDIIDRTNSNSHNNSGCVNTCMGNESISLDPELSELPEHYDLENASSIAPSDIDIVYHYKGFRENLGGRSKSSPFRHTHYGPGSRQSPIIRQSPISNVLKSTPLARLSPSSELSQHTMPRILTLQDISGKPLQSALLAKKDPMSQSERSLNISQSSSRSSIVNSATQRNSKNMIKKNSSSLIGLTAEEIDRLNSSRHKNNSSLVSTLDVVSSSDGDTQPQPSQSKLKRPKNKSEIALEAKKKMMARGKNGGGQAEFSEDEESGNDSFSCSEFEYDNPKQPRNIRQCGPPPEVPLVGGGEDVEGSYRGSLSTLVASDDDLAYINGYSKNPNGGLGWDYLLNWGTGFEHMVSVFKDIGDLTDVASPSENITSNNNASRANRSNRYPTPRPNEEYV